jgi:hypothetical protein
MKVYTMARKRTLPIKYSASGYSVWEVRRTIREAENISRWNPWLAHAWMEEARNELSLEKPFFNEYDAAVCRINDYWLMLTRFNWFDENAFWTLEGESYALTLLNYSTE